MTTPAVDDLHAQHHAVKFYGSDDSLFSTVGTFLGEGLVAGHPAIIIATPAHRHGILSELESRLIDVQRAEASGNLIVRDCDALLALILVDGQPDPVAFEECIGGLIAGVQMTGPGAMIRAYGEMVNVLWKDGQTEAAMKLEMLWNKLALTHRFTLLCGYSMGQFYKQSQDYQAVCEQHSHILETEEKVLKFAQRRVRSA